MKNTFLLLMALLVITGCEKNSLTAQTDIGANTFSCRINGKVFKPCKDVGLFGGESLFGGVRISGMTIASITAKCTETDPHKYVSITIENFRGIGEYTLSDTNILCSYNEYYPTRRYNSLQNSTGKVVITKDDRTNYILSGTFEFTASNINNPNDIINVTAGRFDLSYK